MSDLKQKTQTHNLRSALSLKFCPQKFLQMEFEPMPAPLGKLTVSICAGMDLN